MHDDSATTHTSKRPQYEDAAWLKAELKSAESYFETWRDNATEVFKRYEASEYNAQQHAFQTESRSHILWSNSRLEKPALYSRTPRVVAKTKHQKKDPVARVAAQIIERNAIFQVEDSCEFDEVMGAVVHDAQMTGRGVPRIRYVSEQDMELERVDLFTLPDGTIVDAMQMPPPPDVEIETDDDGTPYYMIEVPSILNERIEWSHVPWKDFHHGKATQWRDVPWVCFDAYLTYTQVEERFGEGVADKLDYCYGPDGDKKAKDGDSEHSGTSMARIREVWIKELKQVFWCSDEYRGGDSGDGFYIEKQDDPLGLKGFYPCPAPLYFNYTGSDLRPQPDYLYYVDDERELDEVMTKRYELMRMIGLRGVFDESLNEKLKNILRAPNGTMIPINMPLVADKGGIKACIEMILFPEIVTQIVQLLETEASIKATIFEKSGLSDILRGSSDPRETATAQQIKGSFASIRLGERQAAVQRVARDLIALAAEVMAEKFDDATLFAIADVSDFDPNDQPFIQAAVALLRKDRMRRIAIDIETDSTIAITEQLQKQAFAEYMQSVGTAIPQFLQLMQASPAAAPYFGQLLLSGSRTFRFGRSFDASLQTFLDALIAQSQQPPPPPQPDPRMMEAQAKMQLAEKQLELDYQKLQVEMQRLQKDYQEMSKKNELEYSRLMTETQLKVEDMRQELDMARMKRADSYADLTIQAMKQGARNNNRGGSYVGAR